MFNDIGLHYWAGPDRYILRLDKYVYTIMCTGKFVNVTGCICADEFEKALFRLKSNVRDPNLTFSLKKCDTISAVSKIKKSIFGRIMKTQASATRFKIKLYHNIPYRLNVSLQIPLKTSPNICANIFTSGSVCIFGARQKEDIDFFLHYINDTWKTFCQYTIFFLSFFPLKTLPNICTNIFTSGPVCIFGACEKKKDIGFFLHYINDTRMTFFFTNILFFSSLFSYIYSDNDMILT